MIFTWTILCRLNCKRISNGWSKLLNEGDEIMKHYYVVAAVVCHDSKYLCMQKGKTKFEYTSYKWEFTGGKIEPGETPQQALARELMEEMEYPVEVGEELVTVNHQYPDFSITMTAFLCTPKGDANGFKRREHADSKWCSKDVMMWLDLAAADMGIVSVL